MFPNIYSGKYTRFLKSITKIHINQIFTYSDTFFLISLLNIRYCWQNVWFLFPRAKARGRGTAPSSTATLCCCTTRTQAWWGHERQDIFSFMTPPESPLAIRALWYWGLKGMCFFSLFVSALHFTRREKIVSFLLHQMESDSIHHFHRKLGVRRNWKLDHFPIDMESNEIPFGSISIKWQTNDSSIEIVMTRRQHVF